MMRALATAACAVCIFAAAELASPLGAAPLESCDNVEPERVQKDCLSRNIEQLQSDIKDRVFAKCKSEAGEGSMASLETLMCAEKRFEQILQEAK